MEGDFGPYLPGRVGSASIITPVKNGHTLSIWRPSLARRLSHSPPGKNQLSSLSFSLSLSEEEVGRYRGKWLEQDWPNRRDQERRRGNL